MSRRDYRQMRRVTSGGNFLPTNLPNLAFWLRADLGITTSAGQVTQWLDQGPSALAWNSVGIVARRPAYNTGGLGGQPFLTWSAALSVDMTLQGPTAIFSAQPMTIYTVLQKNGTTGGKVFRASNASDSMIQWSGAFFEIFASATNVEMTNGDLLAGGDVTCGVWNGASSAGYDNNSQTAVATGNLGTGFADGTWFLGNDFNGTGSAFTGNLYEHFAYKAAHTAAQRLQVFKYLGARYGIAVS